MSDNYKPEEYDEDYYDGELDYYDDYGFRQPGGKSALRCGELCFPCPTCGGADLLTQADVNLGYQCDRCAERDELGGY